MAAVWRSLCVFTKLLNGKSGRIFNNATYFDKTLTRKPISVALVAKNYSNYAHSPFVEKIKEQYDFEPVQNPEVWQYVDRLMPFETIPEVTSKETYPSGWIPPREEAKDMPFFIERTKNHQLPVYLIIKFRGMSKVTHIKKIDGDIWLLNDELKSYLKEKKLLKYGVTSRVHELSKFIQIKGDHVNAIKEWAYNKGF